jgi:hypothetical protein
MAELDPIYFDYNATTPLAPEVINSCHSALVKAWGNPSSSYAAGKLAKEVQFYLLFKLSIHLRFSLTHAHMHIQWLNVV